ncbi:hypothetical protein Dsin_009544 [Dipteronia sinensis]|uniref:RNase H type-1 domain-containing protein n=1 Tax=Dipteronia sinensis TaxID=43782 RepID=A0AAE0EC12_9ROSI|nr:hypothetical protein Dsin_009544 [Dipteronia sinensis]
MTDVASTLGSKNIGLLCTILWRVWYIRNQGVFQKGKNNCNEVIWWSRNYLELLKSANEKQEGKNHDLQKVRNYSWSPPRLGLLKVNCDAVIDFKKQRIGIGIIIRNSAGLVMATSSKMLQANFDSSIAKALAIYRGIQFWKDCGLGFCCIEANAKMVVRKIMDGNLDDVNGGVILDSIEGVLKDLNGVVVMDTHKMANQATHGLAKYGLVIKEDRFWMEEAPSCINHFVMADMPN